MSRSGIQLSVPEIAGPLDWARLDRATLGDASLAREVLGLFDTQSGRIGETIGACSADIAMLAHSLKGSARGIGAWQVANAAQQLEAALVASADPGPALGTLVREISAVRRAIAAHLRNP